MASSYQKLVRNSNSTGVNIPRRIMAALKWLPGDDVYLEVTEDRGLLIHRISREALRRALTIEPDQPQPAAVSK